MDHKDGTRKSTNLLISDSIHDQDSHTQVSSVDNSTPDVHPSLEDLAIIERVREGIKSDNLKSPFSSDKWYKTFASLNKDGILLTESPINKLLMVVSESLGTLIKNGRGHSIQRGSLLVKLADDKIYCLDATSWFASASGKAIVFSNNGYFEISKETIYGEVKEIKDIKL